MKWIYFFILFLTGCSTAVVTTEISQDLPINPAPELPVEVPVEEPEEVSKPPETIPQDLPVEQPTVKFTIDADDNEFNPDEITVNKGDLVIITFNFIDSNIYFGGLDIKSDVFNIEYRKGALKKQTVEFTAEENFRFSSFWPQSNKFKASARVVVE